MHYHPNLTSILRALKPNMIADFQVTAVSLFGSQARHEATVASDIDLLVEFSDEASLFDLIGLKLYLEEQLQQSVDVVPKDSLRMELRDQILNEAVPV